VVLYIALLLGICLIALAIPVTLWLLLARRYGRRPATWGLVIIALCSSIIAGVPTGILATQLENTIFDPSPSTDWHKVGSLDETPTGLEYRTGEGLFAITHSGEEKIAKAPPACLPNDLIAQANSTHHPPPPAEVTTSPHLDLAPPPNQPAYQLTLNIIYPFGTDEYGSVGFAVYNDGEVWCTEEYGRGGLAGGTAFGVAAYVVLLVSIILFTAIFIMTAILASITTIVVLEIRHRRMMSR
jgi:MFS family permease